MTDPLAERLLRDAAAGGCPHSWRALFDTASGTVRTYVRWRAGGWTDLADDAEQETWLTAARKLRSFDPTRGPFAGWVCGIAANVVRAQLRKRRLLPLPENLAAPQPCDKPARVAAALATLPENYEQVLRAKYLDRRTVDEIAATAGESAKAVESRLTRARQAFREAFGEPSDDG